MIDKEDAEAFQKYIDSKLAESKQQEKPKDDSYTIEQIHNHQSKCTDGSCPACKAMNDKVNTEKIKNLMSRTDRLIKNRTGHV